MVAVGLGVPRQAEGDGRGQEVFLRKVFARPELEVKRKGCAKTVRWARG